MTLGLHPEEIVARATSPLLTKAPHWGRIPLGEVAEILNGFAFESRYFNSEGNGMPLIRIRDVGKDHTDTFYSGPYDERYVIQPGSLIIGMDGDFRLARWAGPAALLNQRVCVLRVKDERLLDSLIFYVLPAYLEAIHAQTSSVTVKHLSSRTILQIPVPLPPIQEQHALVGELDKQFTRLDAAVAVLLHSRTNLDRYRASLLQAAVTEPASRQVAGGDDGGWAEATVGELADEVRYGTSVKTGEGSSGVPVLRMGNVVNGELRLDKLKYLPRTHHEFPDLLLEPGDLLFNRTNSPELVGKAAVFRGTPNPCSFASYLIRVRLASGYRPELLAYFLNSPTGRHWARSVVSQQVGQANISGSKLKALRVPVPPPSVQREIVERTERGLSHLSTIERAIATLLRRANHQRQALLTRSFSGSLRASGIA